MPTLTVVKHFDVLEDRSSRFIPGPERIVMDQFVLQGTEETLSDRVVVTATAKSLGSEPRKVLIQRLPSGGSRFSAPVKAGKVL